MRRARSAGDPRRRELAALCLSSEGGATRARPSLARSRALGPDLVRFAWMTLWAFLRISTNPRVFERPLSTSEAEAIVTSWLAVPVVGVLELGERHWEIFRSLTQDGQTVGALVMDAALAAVAIEHGATL